jgi:hypothetical protein
MEVKSDSGDLIPKSGNTTEEILLEFTLMVVRRELSLHDFQLWFKENIKPIHDSLSSSGDLVVKKISSNL